MNETATPIETPQVLLDKIPFLEVTPSSSTSNELHPSSTNRYRQLPPAHCG